MEIKRSETIASLSVSRAEQGDVAAFILECFYASSVARAALCCLLLHPARYPGFAQ